MNFFDASKINTGVILLALCPVSALAEAAWMPASEIVGQPLQVTTNGVTNIVVLKPGGRAAIRSPLGRIVNTSWTATDGQLCLMNGSARECWPYSHAFRAGQPVKIRSSCNSTSTWLAAATNMQSSPETQPGERGH